MTHDINRTRHFRQQRRVAKHVARDKLADAHATGVARKRRRCGPALKEELLRCFLPGEVTRPEDVGDPESVETLLLGSLGGVRHGLIYDDGNGGCSGWCFHYDPLSSFSWERCPLSGGDPASVY